MATSAGGPGSVGMRLSAFFAALFLIHGTHLTYLPVWLDARGLTAFEIGLVSSLPLLIRLVLTPAAAYCADRMHWQREMIIAACALSLTAMIALKPISSMAFTVALVVLMQVALHSIMPLADAVTLAGVKRHGLDYGRIRLWGSATFILASYIAGWAVAAHGAEAVLTLSISAACVSLAAAIWLPRADAGATAARLTPRDALALIRDPRFSLFMATSGIIQASHAVLYLFGVLHWRAQGLSATAIATLWAISVAVEIALFWGARWINWIGPVPLMMLGATAGIVRWSVMALDPSPAWLPLLQVLHAGTFAATHLGAMLWIGAHVPQAAAGTAQALLSTFSGSIVMSVVMTLSGALYASAAGRAYGAMAVVCVIGLACGALLLRLERKPPQKG